MERKSQYKETTKLFIKRRKERITGRKRKRNMREKTIGKENKKSERK